MIKSSISIRISWFALVSFAAVLATGCNRPAEEVEPTPTPLGGVAAALRPLTDAPSISLREMKAGVPTARDSEQVGAAGDPTG